MPRRFLASASLLTFLALVAGCGPRGTTEAQWQEGGFIRHVPADAEGFLSLRRPVPLLLEISPAWSALLSDPDLKKSWLRTPWGGVIDAFITAPQAAPLGDALTQAGEDEVFLVLGRGTAGQLAAVQQVKRLFAAARLRNLFTPAAPAAPTAAEETPAQNEDTLSLEEAAFTEVAVPLPPAMEAALQKFVQNASVPPLLFGAKLPAEDAKLPSLLEAWVNSLPPQIPRGTFDFPPHGKFTRVRVPVALLVPRTAALRARDLLAAQIGDPYTATRIVRELLSKQAFISFGTAHGYFLVSANSSEAPPALAENFDASLAASPAMAHVAPLVAPETEALFYADALIVGLSASPPPVDEYLDAALESALEFAPAAKLGPLRNATAPLRKQAAELFRPRVTAASGIVRRNPDGWRAEMFGGSFAPRLATANAPPLMQPAPAPALLWTEHWEEGYTGRLVDFAAGFARFTADWLETLGPVFLDEKSLARSDAIRSLAQKSILQPDKPDAAAWDRAFGRQRALAVSLDGVMPGPPLLPEASGQALLPRIAVASGLRDRAALARIWDKINPPAPGGRWRPPAPEETALAGGGVCYAYPLPLAGPDLGVAVTIANNRWILGTSAPFTQTLANAPAPEGNDTSIQAVRVQTAPVAAFALAWAGALEKDPSLAKFTWEMIPSDPGTLRAAASVLQQPRTFRYEARWERKLLHRVFEIAPASP